MRHTARREPRPGPAPRGQFPVLVGVELPSDEPAERSHRTLLDPDPRGLFGRPIRLGEVYPPAPTPATEGLPGLSLPGPRGTIGRPHDSPRGCVMSEYSAWFECVNGCPGRYSLLEVIYRCPTCDDLLDVTHDIEPLRRRSARRRGCSCSTTATAATRSPTAPASGGRRRGGPVHRQREHRVDVRGAHEPPVGRTTARCSAWRTSGSSSAGTPGLLQGPGMTVLVSVVKQMIKEASRSRPSRARPRGHVRRARELLRRRRHPGRGPAAPEQGLPAQLVQPLANGALVLSWTPTSTAAWRWSRRSPRSARSTWPTR